MVWVTLKTIKSLGLSQGKMQGSTTKKAVFLSAAVISASQEWVKKNNAMKIRFVIIS